MGVISPILLGLAHIASAVLDIAAIFLVARLAVMRHQWNWLLAFEEAGRPFTDYLIGLLGQRGQESGRALREEVRIALCLIAVVLLRVAVYLIARVMLL